MIHVARDFMSASGVFRASEGSHDSCGGYHEYIGGYSVHWRVLWLCGGYHEYISTSEDGQYIEEIS